MWIPKRGTYLRPDAYQRKYGKAFDDVLSKAFVK